MTSGAQTQAIQTANQIISIATQVLALAQQMQAIDAAWNDDAVAATLAAMNTVTINADGSVGAQDGTVNNAHPISPTLYPGFSRLVSSNTIASVKTVLDNLPNWIMNGAAVTAVGNASNRAILNGVTGG